MARPGAPGPASPLLTRDDCTQHAVPGCDGELPFGWYRRDPTFRASMLGISCTESRSIVRCLWEQVLAHDCHGWSRRHPHGHGRVPASGLASAFTVLTPLAACEESCMP